MKTLALFAMVLLAGCSTVPPTNIHQPMTARPPQRIETANANGAIFQATSSRPLFEDRRARFVGDTITITITENTTASKKSNNKLDKSNSTKASVSAMSGIAPKSLLGGLTSLNANATSAEAFEGKGDAANNNVFSGAITVTVIDVLPNGNLLVSGEKQLSISAEQEFVRLSGVVNPAFVDASNTISSSKVADARIEYKSSGQLSDGMVMGWLSRVFMNVLPF
ncbi:MAG: flagellar basal body L-ring protein FlgH [Proteobacteria bacterium]|nr:flagellar basal body L-ring protein FlgH [Pseudomonadota bacterium]